MDVSKIGFCLLCLKELREGKEPSKWLRPLFYGACPMNKGEPYPNRCGIHYQYHGVGEPPNFFNITKGEAKDVCKIVSKRGVITKKDIFYVSDSIKLI